MCALVFSVVHSHVAAGMVPGRTPTHPPSQSQIQAPAAVPTELKQQVRALLKTSQVRGAAVVWVDASGPVDTAWFGSADVARGVPVSAQTCVRAGGLVNTFTAMLGMRLAEQERLDLDRPLPADLQPKAPAQCAAKVSVAQLLEQTAGVTGAARVAEAQRDLAWCPGLHYRASEDSISLAAAAISRAGGSDFNSLMQREVFTPLGLRQTQLAAAAGPGAAPPCLSRSYARDGTEFESAPKQSASVVGSLISTPLELASVVQMLLRYGHGPVGHVLEACSVAHLALGSTGLASRSGASANVEGRGLKRFAAGGRPVVGYTGQADGFHSVMGLAPEQGRGMVIMLNTDDPDTLLRLQNLAAVWVWQG